jgi:hypothetical protein
MDLDESNRAPQTVESYEESEQVPDNRTETEHVPSLPRRSARLRTNTQHYQPSMSGKKYNYATTVLEPTLHPDAHIWNDDNSEINQQVVAAIFTQLSVKAGPNNGANQRGMHVRPRFTNCI